MLVHASIHGSLAVFFKRIRSHRYNRDILEVIVAQRPNLASGFEAIHHRHLHIHQNQVIGALLCHFEHS